MATEHELRAHLGRLTAILWNFGAAFHIPALEPYHDGARGFSFTARLPGATDPGSAEISLAEIWEPEGDDDYRIVEYAYDFVERPLRRRRAFHRHDDAYFLRHFAVAVHEHCEELLGSPVCDHDYGLPVDAYEAIRRFTVSWGRPESLGCDRLRCMT